MTTMTEAEYGAAMRALVKREAEEAQMRKRAIYAPESAAAQADAIAAKVEAIATRRWVTAEDVGRMMHVHSDLVAPVLHRLARSGAVARQIHEGLAAFGPTKAKGA